jgi:hypothetical protein
MKHIYNNTICKLNDSYKRYKIEETECINCVNYALKNEPKYKLEFKNTKSILINRLKYLEYKTEFDIIITGEK